MKKDIYINFKNKRHNALQKETLKSRPDHRVLKLERLHYACRVNLRAFLHPPIP